MRRIAFVTTIGIVLILLASLVEGLGGWTTVLESDEVMIAPARTRPSERIRVEVLNGAGISGLAREVTERLRADGFDVVYYGNAGSQRRDSTAVIDRRGNTEVARLVASALGIERVELQVDTTLYLEATVVLGPDWPTLETTE